MRFKLAGDNVFRPQIVVPFDFSDRSKYSLKYALRTWDSGDVHAICLLERPDLFSLETPWEGDSDKAAIEDCEMRFAQMFQPGQFSELEFVAKFGDPVTEILHFAKRLNASSIVMSTHGLVGVKRLLLGSVTQNVCVRSICPVTLLSDAWLDAEIQREQAVTL